MGQADPVLVINSLLVEAGVQLGMKAPARSASADSNSVPAPAWMGTASRDVQGATARTCAKRCDSRVVWLTSVLKMRNLRVMVAGSNTDCA